jgi:hypothetical protein
VTTELLRPSLGEGWQETKSYELSQLFYVAFFGGILSTIILGIRNAKWLNVDKKLINIMIGIGAAVMIAKIGIVAWVLHGYSDFKSMVTAGREELRTLKWVFTAAAVMLFIVYRQLMKPKFQQHLYTGGEVVPLFKDGLLWCLVGGLLETILLILGVGLILYVI